MAWDRYASSAKLSSAARGRSFHLDSIPCAMASGSSNVICMATALLLIIVGCSAFSDAPLQNERYEREDGTLSMAYDDVFRIPGAMDRMDEGGSRRLYLRRRVKNHIYSRGSTASLSSASTPN